MNEFESQVRMSADQLLADGNLPTADKIAGMLGLEVADVEEALDAWVLSLKDAVDRDLSATKNTQVSVPEVLGDQINKIWELAVKEASVALRQELDTTRVTDEEEQRSAGDMVRDAEGRYRELERRHREQSQILEQHNQTARGLEAEINVLKANLATEMNLRKKVEQLRANSESELTQLRKQHEDSKKVFDNRIKEEHRQALEAVSRAEVETRHYRNALEKMREDAGRSEAELTREVHELQGLMARKDARIDMQDASVKDLEAEQEELKQSLSTYSREIALLNSRLLKETNNNRRLESQAKEQDEEIRRLNQRVALASNESSKRENGLRMQLKDRDEQLTRSNARINSLEKRVTSQEDQIRRLNSRL